MSEPASIVAVTGPLAVVWWAAWVDIKTYRIPNALVLAAALSGLLSQVWSSGVPGLYQGLGGLGLGLIVLLPGYLSRVTGAGDVKLMGAVGALLGPERVILALLFTLLAGGAMGAVYALAAWRNQGAHGPWKRYGEMLRFFWVTGRPSYVPPAAQEAMGQRLPFAVPIAMGGTAAVIFSLIAES